MRKKRNKCRVYGLLVNGRDLRQMLHKTGQVQSRWKIHSRHSFIHVSVILYISMYINTCILGRTYFVERSIHLIEEHWLLIITGVQVSGVITGADPGFFLGGGALVSCSTSTLINHIVFFFWQNTSCIRKPQIISGTGGAHPQHPPPRSAPESLIVYCDSAVSYGPKL